MTKRELVGWVLFTLGSLTFLVSALRTGEPLEIVGGILFFTGCIAFLWPGRSK